MIEQPLDAAAARCGGNERLARFLPGSGEDAARLDL